MRKLLVTLALFSLALVAKAQDASVEKSTTGIQVGFLGIWAHNEARLTNKLTLRTEFGFDTGIVGGSLHNGTSVIMTPMLIVEPKFYYNLDKRSLKSKDITGNSGNFFSLRTLYYPDWFVISNNDNISVLNQVSVIPSWGMRRNIGGSRFNYETGIGLGYRHVFAKSAGYSENTGEAAFDLRLRIGYRF
jgi:hypothetical protein